MKKTIEIPIIQCDNCGSKYNLGIKISGITITSLLLSCIKCDEEINILEKSSELYSEQKKRLKPLIKRLTKLIIEAKDHIPKNKEDLSIAIKNPKHPFTASVITALVILLMELSGFGIFLVMAWLLGNLVLTPIGWVLIPIVVAVTFTHRKSLKNKRMKEFGRLIKALEEKLNNNIITKEEYEVKKEELFNQYF